jgi:hypothetical protein
LDWVEEKKVETVEFAGCSSLWRPPTLLLRRLLGWAKEEKVQLTEFADYSSLWRPPTILLVAERILRRNTAARPWTRSRLQLPRASS